MSEVMLKLAEPLLNKYGDIDKRIKTIISLTIFEWNRLMLPESEREKFQDEMINTLLPPEEEAETVGSILYLSDLIAERQKKYFPDIKKIIVDYELFVSDGNITLNISSAPIKSVNNQNHLLSRFEKMIKKIISGGQTGADRSALDFALKYFIPHGDWIPKGRITEDGPLPDKYQLKEMPTASYPARNEQNVIDSNGTLIFSRGKPTGGTDYTRKQVMYILIQMMSRL